MGQKPTIGRIVHFHAESETKPQAALVIDTNEDKNTISLAVHTRSGGRFMAHLPFEENVVTDQGYSWCWPPRE